jgi:hypothetical protein
MTTLTYTTSWDTIHGIRGHSAEAVTDAVARMRFSMSSSINMLSQFY